MSRWTKIDASEFHHKAQREGDDLAQNVDKSQKTADGQLKFIGRRSGSENSNFDKVPSKFEEKFKKTFLENQTGFHQPPKQDVIAHQHSLYRDQRYPHQKLLRKIFGKTCHEFVQQADLRRLLQVKPVAIMVPGLSTMSSLSSLSTRAPPTSSTQNDKGSIPDPALTECESEDRQVRETRIVLRRHDAGRMLKRTVNKFSLSLSPSASDSPENTKSESQKVPLSSLNVQQTSTERPVLGASSSDYSEWNIDDKWSPQVRRTGVHPILMCAWT